MSNRETGQKWKIVDRGLPGQRQPSVLFSSNREAPLPKERAVAEEEKTASMHEESARLAAVRALHILDTPREERFDRITRLAAELFDMPIAYVSFVDEQRNWLKSCQGWSAIQMKRDDSLCGQVILRQEPLIIEDALADERFHQHPMVTGAPHVRFYAGYPLASADGHNVGTLCLVDTQPRSLDARQLALFQMLAEMAEHEIHLVDVIQLQRDAILAKAKADAAQQAQREAQCRLFESRQRLEDELTKAATYVESLLPEPRQGPISTEWKYIPSAELGGDAFGYHDLDEDHFALYLLDVSGHGIGVALHSVSVLNVLRSQTLPNTNFYDPSAVLAALNDAFQMKAHNDTFFTIWYGVFNRKTRRLTYATGGHPPALLVTREGEIPVVERLRTPGILIGGIRHASYPSASRIIPEESALYLFSDGAYEIRQEDGSMMNLEQFIDVLSKVVTCEDCAMERLMERIYKVYDCKHCMDDFALLKVSFH